MYGRMTLKRYSDVLLCVQLAVREVLSKKTKASQRRGMVIKHVTTGYGRRLEISADEVEYVLDTPIDNMIS